MISFLLNPNIELLILAYVVAGIPFGLILAKLFAKVDITQSGSHSIGATNVLRVVKEKNPSLAKKLAIATIVLDALKGFVLLVIAKYFGTDLSILWGMGVMAVLGHCYSVFLKFEGGKGVATGLGVFLFFIPIPTLIGAIVWGVCAKTIKISSLSSLLGLSAVIISAYFLNNGLGVNSNVPMYLIGFIIFYKHLPNIYRLLTGQEKRVV